MDPLSPPPAKALRALRTDVALALCPPSDVSQERGSSTRRRPLERRNGGQGEGAGGGRAPERGPRAWPPSAPRPLPTRSCHGPLSPNVSPSHLRGGVILGTLGTCHSPWDASQLGSHGRGRGPCVRLWWGPASAPRAVSEAPRCPAKGGERASPGAGSRGLPRAGPRPAGNRGPRPRSREDEVSCGLTASSHCC